MISPHQIAASICQGVAAPPVSGRGTYSQFGLSAERLRTQRTRLRPVRREMLWEPFTAARTAGTATHHGITCQAGMGSEWLTSPQAPIQFPSRERQRRRGKQTRSRTGGGGRPDAVPSGASSFGEQSARPLGSRLQAGVAPGPLPTISPPDLRPVSFGGSAVLSGEPLPCVSHLRDPSLSGAALQRVS